MMYELPSLDLITEGDDKAHVADSDEIVEKLTETFYSFDVGARVVDYVRGPTVTRYEVELSPGTPVRKVEGMRANIAYTVGASDVRIISPIPGKSAIGIEIANPKREIVQLRNVLENIETDKPWVIGYGQDIEGNHVSIDIAKLPHVLVAGATGSGKSVFLNSIIVSVLMRAMPWEVQFMLIDPKQVEFAPFAGIPHLLCPIITDATEAGQALREMCKLMDSRYDQFKNSGVRNIDEYNKAYADDPMPRIVVIIDEMADLMMIDKKGVEKSIVRISQLARAAGIHLVLATQRPTVEFVTGAIKSNMPSRLSFAVSSGTDSRVILDQNGAQALLGMGDSLYLPNGASEPTRVQGAWVSGDDISKVVDYWTPELTDEPTDEVVSDDETTEQAEYQPRHAGDAADETEPVSVEPARQRRRVPPPSWTMAGRRDDEPQESSWEYAWVTVWRPILMFSFKVIWGVCYVSVMVTLHILSALCGTRGPDGTATFRNTMGFQPMNENESSFMGSARGNRQEKIQNTPGVDGGLNGDLFNGLGDK